MSELISAAAVNWADAHTTPLSGQLAEVAGWTQEHTAAPQMMSGLAETRLLQALLVVGGAQRVLEIGTFTGLGSLAMAAVLPPDGHLTTLEKDEQTAATAREHFAASPYRDRIELIVGDALQTLTSLEGPYDLVYIDAWKADYPAYYDAVLPMLSPRGVIVADNLFRGGMVLDDAQQDDGTAGMREFTRRVQADERSDNALLTVGDGLMVVWRRPAG